MVHCNLVIYKIIVVENAICLDKLYRNNIKCIRDINIQRKCNMLRRIIYAKKSAYVCDLKTVNVNIWKRVLQPRVETFHYRISWIVSLVCKLHNNDEIDAITSGALKHTACLCYTNAV